MTFAWTRDGIALVSRCQLCGMSTRSLSESAIYLRQRAHTWQDCQQWRLAAALTAARAVVVLEGCDNKPTHCRNHHEYTPENTRVDAAGIRHCQTCAQDKGARQNEARRWARAARHGAEFRCDTTGLGPDFEAKTGRLRGHKAAPITSRGLTAKTIEES